MAPSWAHAQIKKKKIRELAWGWETTTNPLICSRSEEGLWNPCDFERRLMEVRTTGRLEAVKSYPHQEKFDEQRYSKRSHALPFEKNKYDPPPCRFTYIAAHPGNRFAFTCLQFPDIQTKLQPPSHCHSLVPSAGFEPATSSVSGKRSSSELRAHANFSFSSECNCLKILSSYTRY